jgi:hypothetical protein
VEKYISIPHRIAPGLCPVNGIRDLLEWRTGHNWSNEFIFGLGQGGGFAYLRFNAADLPRQVYWGTASSRQHRYLADLLRADFSETENRSFKFSWRKAQEALNSGTPPVIGPLDVYHLKFYKDIYHQRHIPIHYLLLVGFDALNAYVYDTGYVDVQVIPLEELALAWDVNIPGMGKRNRLVTLNIPNDIGDEKILVQKSIRDECQMMLEPPISMLGIPAIEKVARELADWPQELGKEVADRCLLQVREYLSSPPDVMGSHLTAGRDIYITFLEQAGEKAGLDFHDVVDYFQNAILQIPVIAEAIQIGDLAKASACFKQIANLEKAAFTCLLAKIEP